MAVRAHKPYTKAEIMAVIARLPEDAALDDAIDRLYFIRSLELPTRRPRQAT
jgi:hypothetical protein